MASACGQLRPRVDAVHLVLGDQLEGHAMAARARDLNGVGQVVFAGLVLVIDAREQVQEDAAIEGHDAGIAQGDGALFGRCVLFLADGQKLAAARGDEAAIALWVLGMKPGHDHLGAAFEGAGERGQAFGRNERGVAIKDEDRALLRLQRRPRGEHRVRGAEALFLHKKAGFDGRVELLEAWGVRRDDGRTAHRARRRRGPQHMRNERRAGQRMQDLRDRRFHAGSLPRRQNHRVKSSHALRAS